MKKFLAVSFAMGLSTVAWAGGAGSPGGADCNHPDSCGYPKNIPGNPKASVVFTENDAIPTAGLTSGTDPNKNTFAAWYTEEFALIVGVGQVDTISNSGHVTAGPLVSPAPSVGAPPHLGLETVLGNDAAGRPARPVLYLTNISSGSSTSGDWQMGGTPVDPTGIFGTGKAAVNYQIGTPTPATALAGVADPPRNHFPCANTGVADCQTPLGTFGGSAFQDQGFSSEIAWNLPALGLASGTYRAQVIVHQGDTASGNWWSGWGRSAGDVIQAGEYCTTFVYTAPPTGCSAQQAYYSTGSSGNTPPNLTYFTVSLTTGAGGACVCPASVPTQFAGSAPMTLAAGYDPNNTSLTLSCGAGG